MSERDNKYYENYAAFSKIIGTWLSGYGIAFIVFIASQETIASTLLNQKEQAKQIVCYVLLALAIQVISALLYKITLAYLAHGEKHADFKSDKRYTGSKNFHDWYMLEIVFDFTTVALYFCATYKLVNIILINA